MHLFLNYQSLNTFGSKDIAQVKTFQKVKVQDQGQKSWGAFSMQLYIKYKRPNTFGSTDIFLVNVFQN